MVISGELPVSHQSEEIHAMSKMSFFVGGLSIARSFFVYRREKEKEFRFSGGPGHFLKSEPVAESHSKLFRSARWAANKFDNNFFLIFASLF